MQSTITDVQPGTVPAWVLRCAYDGDEWLVLAMPDTDRHTCGLNPSRGYRLARVREWTTCDRGRGCEARVGRMAGLGAIWRGDSRAEAHAAFERIEAEWRERER